MFFAYRDGHWGDLVYLLVFAGLSVAVSGFVAVSLSERAYLNLNKLWKERLSNYSGAPRNGFELRAEGWPWRRLLPQNVMPFVFFVCWLVVLIFKLSGTSVAA